MKILNKKLININALINKNHLGRIIILSLIISCSKEKNTTNDTSLSNIWDGPLKFFEKKDNTSELDKDNQDSITENVIITHANCALRRRIMSYTLENI